MRAPHYVWLISPDGEKTLAYYYENPNAQQWGYGFNIADGGGFLPEDELDDAVKVLPAIVGVHVDCVAG